MLRADRGPNAQTARHRLTFTEVWQLPVGRGRAFGSTMSPALDALVGGWQVSSITSWRTGMPVNVGLSASGTDPATGLPYTFFSRNGGSIRPSTGVDPNALRRERRSAALSDPAAYSAGREHARQPRLARRGARALLTTDLALKRFTFFVDDGRHPGGKRSTC